MDIKTKEAINEIINVMEKCEADMRALVEKHNGYEMIKSPFKTGLVGNIVFIRTSDKEDNSCFCMFEFSDSVSIYGIGKTLRIDEPSEIDLGFVTKEIFDNDFVPALREWGQHKVDNEEYGGLHEMELQIHFKLETDNLPFDKADTFEDIKIDILDEKRLAKQKQLIHDFIINKKYESVELKEFSSYYRIIYSYLTDDVLETLGMKYLLLLTKEILKKIDHYRSTIFISAVCATIRKLSDNTEGKTPTKDKLVMAYELAVLLVTDENLNMEYDSRYNYNTIMKNLHSMADQGLQEARDFLGLDNKRDPKEILSEAEKWVTMESNENDAIVEFSIKEECADAYIAMVTYLIELRRNDFPREYRIVFDSEIMNYIPTELSETDMNKFFANAAEYPETHDLLNEYARMAFNLYSRYTDTMDVPCGGYAAMALAFKDPVKYFKVAEALIGYSDLDHDMPIYYFMNDFVDLCEGENRNTILQSLVYMEC